MRAVLLAAVCFALSITACVSYSATDKSGRTIADYDAAIETEPRKPELYYNRALLYVEQYYHENGELKRCAEDMDKAIRLLDANAVSWEYYAQRGFCSAGAVLESGYHWNVHNLAYGTHSKEEVKEADKAALMKAAEDYGNAIRLNSNPTDLVELYESRGLIFYQLEKYKEAASDFFVVVKLDDKILRRSTESRKQYGITDVHDKARVWLILADIYERLLKEAKAKGSGEVQQLESLHKSAAGQASEYQQLAYAENEARYRKTAEERDQSRKEAEQRREERKAEAYANRQTCGHCRGTGEDKYYDMGTARECYTVKSESGSTSEKCSPGKSGGFSTRTCPVCGGKGYVLPEGE
jgi:tetratricopeptide (TPR) repeat protein